MQNPRFVTATATTVCKRRRRCFPPFSLASNQPEHIWISDSLVRHVFRAYSSKWIKPSTTHISSFWCPAIKGRRTCVTRELRTASAKWSARPPNPQDGRSATPSEGLFSWSSKSKSKTPSLFDKSLPPWRDPSSAGAVKDRDILKTLTLPADKISSEDTPIGKHPPSIIGFDDGPNKQAPRPFLRNFQNRLDHLIEHGTQLPSSRVEQELDIENSARRSRWILNQTQELFVDILPRLYGADKAHEMLVGEQLLDDRKSLQLVPYFVPAHALIAMGQPENIFKPELMQKPSTEISDVPQPVFPYLINLESSELETDISPPPVTHPTEITNASKIEIRADSPAEAAAIPPTRGSNTIATNLSSTSGQPRRRRRAKKPIFKLSPSLSKIEKVLKIVLNDTSVPPHTSFLILSQINAIYGIENLRCSGWCMEKLSDRLGAEGLYYTLLLPQHPLVKDYAKSTPPGKGAKEDISNLKNIKAKFIFGNKEFDDPFRSHRKPLTSKKLCQVWKQVKRRSRVPDELFRETKSALLPVSTAMLVLEQGVNIISLPGWDLGRAKVADVIIDVFHYNRKDEKALSFLFTYLVEFARIWQSKWGTKNFIDSNKRIQHHVRRDATHQRARKRSLQRKPPIGDLQKAPANPNFRVPKIKNIDRYRILGLDKLLNKMPSDYVDRLITTLLLQPHSKPSDYNIPITNKDYQLHHIYPLAPWCRGRKGPVENNPLKDLAFLEDPTIPFKAVMANKTHEEIADYLSSATDYQITEFHLRNLATRLGPDHKSNESETFHATQRRTIQNICIDVKENLARHDRVAPRYQPGLPFAQAIMSLFYYNKLPLQIFVKDLLQTLAILGRTNSLKSCVNILCDAHEKKGNGLIFRTPRLAIAIGLKCLYMEDPLWALGMLQTKHHIRQSTRNLVLLHAAKTHPQQTHAFIQEYLRKLEVKSELPPVVPAAPPVIYLVSEKTPIPSAGFLAGLAKSYAVSDAHTPNSATRKILDIRFFMRKQGYGADIRIARSLVAVAMIRTAAYRLWTGPPLNEMKELFDHGRVEFAIETFMKDAEQDPLYLKGLDRLDRFKKQREFVERCMAEIWEEVDIFQRVKYSEGVRRNSMFTSVI
ncbi:hypothetical protein TWF694_009875 [Orbilia ellipsospora]|uniref:HNH nuclease domain-containing protein n=1 Tax=Orbilia ellipsospora TaxID=2528407 RepID=A0AAV9XD45_9PEZI